jgi:hypothetical protein
MIEAAYAFQILPQHTDGERQKGLEIRPGRRRRKASFS